MRDNLVGRDAEVLEALAKAGSARGAAKLLGVHHASVQRAQKRIAGERKDTDEPVATVSALDEIRASERGENGYDPVIPGFAIKQISSQDGDAWIKQVRAPGDVFQVPDGQVVAGVSALVDQSGRELVKWVKTKEGPRAMLTMEAIKAAFAQ